MIANTPPKGVFIVFNAEECRMLLDESIAAPPEILRQIEKAQGKDGSARVCLSLDDLELLVDGVAADANHADSEQTEGGFDDLFMRLSATFDKVCGIERESDDFYSIEALAQDLMDLLAQSGGDAPDWIKETMAKSIDKENAEPLAELGGLSAGQTYFMNYAGWWAEPYPIRLADDLPADRVNRSSLLRNARIFLWAITEAKGTPATAAGNLPRAFVAQMLEVLDLPPGELDAIRRYNKVINEQDVWALHLVRVICQGGGLIKQAKKRFSVTRKAKQLLKEDKAGALYRHLFDTTFRKFNLGYMSRLPDTPGVQATAPYALYRIGQLETGKAYEVEELIEVAFLPAVIEEIAQVSSYEGAPRWLLEGCILGPLERLGLVEILREEDKTRSEAIEHRVRKLPLFDAFIRFEF